jgi:hypothetical protein
MSVGMYWLFARELLISFALIYKLKLHHFHDLAPALEE